MSEKKIITMKPDDKDVAELERCAYEVTTSKRLIEYFVNLMQQGGELDALKSFVDRYSKDLATAEMHRQMLMNKVMDAYFPDGLDKETTTFFIDFERKEICYTYDSQETAQLQ